MRCAIFVLAGLAAFAHAAQTVEGHVVSSATGASVPGVDVNLRPAGAVTGTALYSSTTDANGRFRIEGVRDGAYTASYGAYGFWRFPGMFDGTPPSFQVASGGDPVHLESKLAPIGKISGRVLDAMGKPVSNASVVLRWESWACSLPFCLGFAPHATSNEKGEYSITDLEVPGAWLVSATAPASWPPPKSQDDQPHAWSQTFYPGVTDPQLASRFIIQPGREIILDIELAAVPVHRIRGKVLDIHGEPMPKATVVLGRGFGSPIIQQDAMADGTFDFESITDGDWGMSAKVDRDGVKLWTSQAIQLKGRDLDDIELKLTASFPVKGKAVVVVPQGVPALHTPGIMLAFHGGTTPVYPAGSDFVEGNPNADGDFTIRNVYPGPYQVLPPPPPYILDSVRLGDRNFPIESDIQILSGAQQLFATYKTSGTGIVRGTVQGKDVGYTHVVLIPQSPGLRRTGFIRHTTCGPDGGFEIPAISGEYYILAIAGDSLTPWYAGVLDDTLIKQASSITVRANESTSAEVRSIVR